LDSRQRQRTATEDLCFLADCSSFEVLHYPPQFQLNHLVILQKFDEEFMRPTLPQFFIRSVETVSIYMCVGFKTFLYVVRPLDSIASYLPIGLPVGVFRSWPSLFLPSSFSSVFLVLPFVLASTSMLFWAICKYSYCTVSTHAINESFDITVW
jgi:hypothetical protein